MTGGPGGDGLTARREHVRQLIEASGVADALRPFLLQPDKEVFTGATPAGAVVFGRAGRVAVVVGDPIGPDGWAAFDAFLEAARTRDLRVGLYQATAASGSALEERGFRVIPVGREAVLNLADFTLAGSPRANLRHTITRARRDGVTVRWCAEGVDDLDAATMADVVAMDRAWSELAGAPIGFTITRFRPEMVREQPTAMAFDSEGRCIALVTLRACGPDAFVVDVMRRRPGSVPGALEACIAEAASALGRRGARTLSLALAPLTGLDAASDVREERWLAQLAAMARSAYDVEGLAFFKAKFDPEWQTRYLAFQAGAFAAVTAGLVWLHLSAANRAPLAVGAGVVAGTARSVAARARAISPAERAALRSNVASRAAVAGAAAAAAWAGARASRAGGRSVVSVGAGVAAAAWAMRVGARRAPFQGRSTSTWGLPSGEGTRPSPDLTVLIAARNEEGVLPRLLEDLAAQDHVDDSGGRRFRVIVVDDRSSDQTLHRAVAAARRLGIVDIVSVRARRGRDLPEGKGAALSFVPIADCAEIIVVLDADARLGPHVLREAAGLAAGGMRAFTLRRQIDTASGSWLALAQADEQALDARVETARWSLGGGSQFRGNGIVIDRALLAEAGGWRAAVTEDLDLSARLAAAAGVTVAWPSEPQVGEEPVLDGPSLWRQRVRWAEGAIRATVDWWPALLTSPRVRATTRLDRLGYVAQLALPFAAIGAVIDAVGRRAARRAIGIPLVLYGVAVTLAYEAIGGDDPGGANHAERSGAAAGGAHRLVRSSRAGLVVGLWFAAVPRAALRVVFGRGPIRYEPTRHAVEERRRP